MRKVADSNDFDLFLDEDLERKQKIDKLLGKVEKLDMLPQVAQKIMALTNDPRSKITDLEKAINSDQALMAKILMISNSAIYGLEREVKTLRRAIVVLGFKELKDIAISAALLDMYGRIGEIALANWDHAVGVAISARVISLQTEEIETDETFIAGLMHDLGKVIFYKLCPDDYQKVFRAYNDREGDSITVEENIFGFNHTELGAAVARFWNFSDVIQKVVRFHHSPVATYSNNFTLMEKWTVAIVNLADRFCHKLGIGLKYPEPNINLFNSEANKILKLEEDRIQWVTETIKMRFFEDKSLFM